MNREDLAAAIEPHLRLLYGERSGEVGEEVLGLAERYASRIRRTPLKPSQATTYLITYGDAIRRDGETPLHTLAQVLHDRVADIVSDVHLLPMFPWTSDDGFAVVDPRRINPALGSWDDVAMLADDHGLLFDFVANHVSASSPWFDGWLAGDPSYAGYFIEQDASFDDALVVRPRVSPVHHDYRRPDGSTASVWTTFGPDQVDINLNTPEALLELTDVLLGYLERGASGIRLDAIGFLWKESGTTCIHLPQTHAIVKLWRALVDGLAPGTQLLTETNVPHAENISYFGNRSDEAHMVYQFALPPLVLHSFVSGSTARLTTWAKQIGPVSETATWFNFLASHDGIGLRPTEGILDDSERQALVDRTLAHGGRVSMAASAPGHESVYELNLSYLDALATPEEVASDEIVVAKALAAHSILFSLVGVPAVYYHSLFGSGADHEGMHGTGINRRINRAVLDADVLLSELEDNPRRRAVFDGMAEMLRTRGAQPAFTPYGGQQVEELDDRVFAVRRGAGTAEELLSITNVTGEPVTLEQVAGHDVITGKVHISLHLDPWGYVWLRPPVH